MTISILYVDDEPDLREVAIMSLELDPELQVKSCGSGAEALELLAGWQPDLVLLDLMMPGMDGVETYARMRGLKGPDLPIAFITARSGGSDISHLMSLGAVGVISKPFDPMALAAQVRQLAGR